MSTTIKGKESIGTIRQLTDSYNGHGNGSGGDGDDGKKSEKIPIPVAKIMLWCFIAAVIMLFAAFTSAYIVKKAGDAASGKWAFFKLPDIFWFNTIAILLSSGTMHWAWLSLKRDNFKSVKIALGLTALLGIFFVAGQFIGWQILTEKGIILSGNPSHSFLYLISGTHAAHILGGIIFLFVVFFKSLRMDSYGVGNHFTSKNKLTVELCATYWHFMDGLWIYLFIFLLVNQG